MEAGSEKRFKMPASVGPRTLMRSPALYEYNADGFEERSEPLRDDLSGRVLNHFFNDNLKTSTIVGDHDE